MNVPEPVGLPCGYIVARGVDLDDLTRSVPKRVRKSAFMPRRNGLDNDGLSVTGAVDSDTLRRLRQHLQRPEKEAVTLHVGHVREISVAGCALDVQPDPVAGDPHHALIIGFPPRHANESTQDKADCNRLAELLAAHARCCVQA